MNNPRQKQIYQHPKCQGDNLNCKYKTSGGLCIIVKCKDIERFNEILSSKIKAFLYIQEPLPAWDRIALNMSLGTIETKCFLKAKDIYLYAP